MDDIKIIYVLSHWNCPIATFSSIDKLLLYARWYNKEFNNNNNGNWSVSIVMYNPDETYGLSTVNINELFCLNNLDENCIRIVQKWIKDNIE